MAIRSGIKTRASPCILCNASRNRHKSNSEQHLKVISSFVFLFIEYLGSKVNGLHARFPGKAIIKCRGCKICQLSNVWRHGDQRKLRQAFTVNIIVQQLH